MKNNNKMRNFFLIALLGLFVVSCSDVLEVENDSVVFAEDHFRTGGDVNSSILGLYALLQPVAQQVVLYNEVRGDLVQTTTTADADLLQLASGDISATNKYVQARDFYKLIANCNDILAQLGNVSSIDPAYTATIRKQDSAEVVGVRTWTYFQIFKLFGKISYYTHTLSTVGDVASIDTNLVKTYADTMAINKLMADISPRISSFTQTYATSISAEWQITRFNRYAARALYAELLMYKGALVPTALSANYQLAATQLWSVLNEDASSTSQQKYKVGSTYGTTNWVNIFLPLATSYNEVVWAIDFSKTYEQTHSLHGLFYASPKLAVSTTATTYLTGTTDKRVATSIAGTSVKKYSISTSTAMKTSYEADAPIILYRAADLHLMYAEAINRSNYTVSGGMKDQPDSAMRFVNGGYVSSVTLATGIVNYNASSQGVRGRLGLTALVVSGSGAAKISSADGFIRDERIRELAFEGKRWEYLVRQALLNNASSITVTRGGTSPVLTIPKAKWYAPVE